MYRGLYLLAANTMAVILLSLDANDYFNQKKAGVQLAGSEREQLDNAHYFTISALWSIYGARCADRWYQTPVKTGPSGCAAPACGGDRSRSSAESVVLQRALAHDWVQPDFWRLRAAHWSFVEWSLVLCKGQERRFR
jgi:hypothetical protein